MKEQRVEKILSSLQRFDYLTRKQIQDIHDLKGDRNANRFLMSMDEYLGSFRNGLEKVYYLNKAGRERIGSTIIRKKTPNIDHFLLRNQLWIHLNRPADWENEIKVQVADVSIVCDAKFTAPGNIPTFVEIDIHQPMANNQKKIEKYKRIKELTDQKFRVIYATATETRKPKLNVLLMGLAGRVYTSNEIQ